MEGLLLSRINTNTVEVEALYNGLAGLGWGGGGGGELVTCVSGVKRIVMLLQTMLLSLFTKQMEVRLSLKRKSLILNEDDI